MTKDDTRKSSASPVTNLMEAMQDASRVMMPGFGPEWFETMNILGTEMLAFISERIKKDLQTQQDLLQAKGIAEVQKIQINFVKNAIEEYSAETAKLMDLAKNHEKHGTPV